LAGTSNFCLFYSQPALVKNNFRQNIVAEVSFAGRTKKAVAEVSFTDKIEKSCH